MSMNAVKRLLIALKIRLVMIQTVLIHAHVTKVLLETGKYAQVYLINKKLKHEIL